MPRSSKAAGSWRDPKVVVRVILGVLVVANLVAAGLVLFPPGGSAEDLQRQLASLQSRIQSGRTLLDQTRLHVAAVEKAREQGDKFLNEYFLQGRTAYSTLVSELVTAATESKITAREASVGYEPVEGSDTLEMLSITANYEGTYANLIRFVHAIDTSQRLLIIESLNAQPQKSGAPLSVSMKLETFVRENGQDLASDVHSSGVGE